MARAGWSIIGVCLLGAIAVHGAAAQHAARAEEAAAKADHAPAAESKGGSAGHAAGEGAGKPESKPADAAAQEPDRGDSRSAVVPHDLPIRREDGRGPKVLLRSFTRGNAPARRVPASPPPGAVTRNAIGVAIAPHDDISHRDMHVAPFVVHAPVAAIGIGAHAGGIAKAPAVPEIGKFTHPALPASVAPVRRGAISGTGVVQRGFGPSRIGGPVKTVAGISGSNIRPRH